jgi:gliding motility-associated-like protein
MRKTRMTLFSVLLLWLNYGFAQLNTEGAFGGVGHDSIVSVNPTIDGQGFVAFGSSNSFSASTEAFLMRTDQAGNYSWARVISSTNTNIEPVAAIEAHGSSQSNQEYIICYHTNSSDILQLLRYNYNSDSNVDSAYYSIQMNYMKAHAMVRTTNGYIVVISSNNGRSAVFSFDANLNLVAHKAEQHSSAHITDVIVDNGRIFIAGTGTDNQYMYIKEVDENLNSTGIGEKIYGVAFDQGGTARVEEVQIARNQAGEFVIATHSTANPLVGKVIIKLDANGNNPIAYEYGIQNQADFFITDVAATDAGFVFTGYTNSTYVNSQGEEDVMIVTVDNNIKLLKASIFGKDKEDRGQFIFANDDATVTIYAKSSSFSQTGDDDFYVIKTGASASVLCNETVVNFTLEQETINNPGAQTLYDWNYTPGAASSTVVTVTSDAVLTALCGCEQTLSFDASAEACTGEPVMISLPGGNLDYIWDFGGSFVDSSVVDGTLFITYTTAGIKQIRLGVANNSCFKPGTAAVTVYPTPQITISAPANVCANEEVEFNCNVTPKVDSLWKYNWNFGKNATPSMSSAINPKSITYQEGNRVDTITLTVSDAHCSNVKRQTITINPTPIADFSASGPKCTGENVEFIYTGTEAATASLTWNFDGGVNNGTSANPQVTYPATESGEKLITLTASIGSCSTEVQNAITINQSPSPAFTLAQSSICAEDTINFTAPTQPTGVEWSYKWDFSSAAAPTSSTAQNPESIAYTEAGVHTITLTIASLYCTGSATQSLTVNATPKADFEANGPKCTGEEVEFVYTGTEAATASFSWDFDGGVNSNTNAAPIVTYSDTQSGEKTVVLTASIGACSTVASKTVTINQSPDATFSLSQPNICARNTMSFVAPTQPAGIEWNYNWDFAAGAEPTISTAQNPSDVLFNEDGTKTISLTIKSAYCSDTKTQTLFVTPTPDVSFESSAPACSGDTVRFIFTGDAKGGDFSWSFDGEQEIIDSSNTTPSVKYPRATEAEKIVRLQVNALGCVDTASLAITIHETPAVSFIYMFDTLCVNELNRFVNTGSSGDTWKFDWDLGAKAFPSVSKSENPKDVSYQTSGAKAVTLIVSSNYCSNSFVDSIYVNALPKVDIINDATVCANESIYIGGDSVPTYTYSWYPSKTLQKNKYANPLAYPDAEITTYTLTVTDKLTGCVNSDSVVITKLAPVTADAGIDVEICRGDSITIGAGASENVNDYAFIWEDTKAVYSKVTNVGIPYLNVSPDSTTVYNLSVYKINTKICGTGKDQVKVIVHQLPIVKAKDFKHKDTTEIALGESVQLIATGATQYEWTPYIGLNNEGIYNPVASPEVTTYYTVKGTDIFGCSNTDSVQVIVNIPQFWAPSAFSPDGDGINDYFKIETKGAREFSFSIFARNGEMVFHTDSPEEAWDGTKNGTDFNMPQGAYVYSISGTYSDGEAFAAKGIINLIR